MFEKSPVAFLDELAQNVGGTKRWWADQARAGKIPARDQTTLAVHDGATSRSLSYAC